MGLIRISLLALLAAGCVTACGSGGAAPSASTAARSTSTAAGAPGSDTASAFAWLSPAPPPPAWRLARVPGGAALAYPPSWRRIRADSGAASAARVDPSSGLIVTYLNATPQQGEETLQNWATFRPAHNREEGDTAVQVLAAARDLRFRNGRGACVIDRYRTTRTTYQEIACLVQGAHGTNVIVAAALAARWAKEAPVLERAVSAFLS